MKTPDEIKKGLEVCAIGAEFGCIDRFCPYGYLEDEGECCDSVLCADALAYIQKLEQERDFWLEYLTNAHMAPCDICKHEPETHDINDCKHIREVGIPCFEWRGLCKEKRRY